MGATLDRTDFVPSHEGDNVLPCDPLFTRLLALARRPVQQPAIRDVNAGIDRTHAQLLGDILNFRRLVRAALAPAVLDGLRRGDEVWISILAPGGYNFAVATLAALALGAAVSPLSIVQPVNEAAYYVRKSKAVAVLAASSTLKLGRELETEIRRSENAHFTCLEVQPCLGNPSPDLTAVTISSNLYLDMNAAGLLIFTSGTTGPPKGAALRRGAISDGAMSFADQLRLTDQDRLLHILPVHHVTGIWVGFFPFILVGACIEFKSGSFDPEWTWKRWKEGGVTHFSGVPTIYMRMKSFYEEHLLKLPHTELEKYRSAPSRFKVCMCGTSALPRPINQFWTELLHGRRIIQRYGATESGVVFNMSLDDKDTPDGSVGEATVGVDVKLSGGDEGEVLVRSWNMFRKYIYDEAATRIAHDAEGYYHTGDLARKEGKYYYIIGRALVDIIKSGGYKISALDVEREILSLSYIGEVMVVGVPDAEFGQRVGAVLSLRTDEIAQQFFRDHGRDCERLILNDLRADLRSQLAGYKMPTLLRLIKGELPKTPSGKVVKKALGPKYFPESYPEDSAVQIWSTTTGSQSYKL